MSKHVFVMAAVVAQLICVHPALAESVKFNITEFAVEGSTLLSEAEINNALAPFVGAEREMADVNKAAEALRSVYQKKGYSVVQVIPPQQTIESGKVQLKVVEDKIAAVDVAGNSAYSANNIRASLPILAMGRSLNAYQLESAIALANENSAKQIGVNVQPGAKLGDINTRIDVNEDKVSKYVTTLDNTGSAATGYAKAGLAYQHANLFDRDHALTLQVSGSTDMPDKVYSVNGGYHIPVYQYGLSVDLMAAYSSTSTNSPAANNGNIFFAGKGSIFGARVNYALPSFGDVRQKLIGGIDYKDTNNTFTACVAPCGSITEIPLSMGYFAQLTRPEFQGSAGASLLVNQPGGQHGGSSNYLTSRFAYGNYTASPNWKLWRANANGSAPLPHDWQLRTTVNAQFASDLLLPAEQIGAGGASSVRGYPERVAAGDKGYMGNVELYTPDFGKYLNMSNASLRALTFWDAASVTVNDQYAVGIPRTTNLYSVGLGLRMAYKRDFNVKLDVGWAQRALPGAAAKPVKKNDAAGHVAVSYLF
jgi:hemolysin activation/secretion protein